MTKKIGTTLTNYVKPDASLYTGRISDDNRYLHEKIMCLDLNTDTLISPTNQEQSFALLGYTCDEGVRRNQGRVGAAEGSIAMRKVFGALANHLHQNTHLLDLGNINCMDQDLEHAQHEMTELISFLHGKSIFPLVIGGGHDLSFAHYLGIKEQYPNKKIGIVNFDAHFDLRKIESQGNSGTPFNQISKLTKDFNYLCLGINRASNTTALFETAEALNVRYIEDHEFNMYNFKAIKNTLEDFINSVDHLYITIDMDGFSAAYSPGVSAPSSIGFCIDIVLASLKTLCATKKIVSADIVEFNPTYDQDNRTAKLVSQLAYFIIRELEKR